MIYSIISKILSVASTQLLTPLGVSATPEVNFADLQSVVRSADGVNGVAIVTMRNGEKLVIKPVGVSDKEEVFASHFLSQLFPHTPRSNLLTPSEVQSFIENTEKNCPNFFSQPSTHGHSASNYQASSMEEMEAVNPLEGVKTSGWIVMPFVESARTLEDFSLVEATPFPDSPLFYKEFGALLACDVLLRNDDRSSLVSVLEFPNKRTNWRFNAGNVLFRMSASQGYLGMASIDTNLEKPNVTETYATSLFNFIASLKALLTADMHLDLGSSTAPVLDATPDQADQPPPRPPKPGAPPPITPRTVADPKSLTKEYVNQFLHHLFKLKGPSSENVMTNPLIRIFAEGFLDMAQILCEKTEECIAKIRDNPQTAHLVQLGAPTILGEFGTLKAFQAAMASDV